MARPQAPTKQQGFAQESRRRRGLTARLRTYLIAGIAVTAPIGITIYLAVVFVQLVDERMRGLIPAEYDILRYLPFDVPGLGVLALLLALLVVGFFAASLVGRMVFRLGESIIDRVPVIRSIYGALKQIFETVFADSSSFRDVVLVEYPRRGLWAVGFITGRTRGEVKDKIDSDPVNIFVPTTPNPTSGFLLCVPRTDLVNLDMSVEDGMKMVISAGIVTPPRAATDDAGEESANSGVETTPQNSL